VERYTSIVVNLGGVDKHAIGLIEKFSDRVTALRCQ